MFSKIKPSLLVIPLILLMIMACSSLDSMSGSPSQIVTVCIETFDEKNGLPINSGYLVLFAENESDLIAYDLETGHSGSLTDSSGVLVGVDISPNRQWLAYVELNAESGEQQLRLVDDFSEPPRTIEWEEGWRTIAGWVNNETLAISSSIEDFLPDNIVLLNPFSRATTPLVVDTDELWVGGGQLFWGGFSRSDILVNPQIDKVLLASRSEDYAGLSYRTYPDNDEIAFVPTGTFFSFSPQWANDGESVIFNNSITNLEQDSLVVKTDQELFQLDQGGNLTRLTHITDYFEYSKIGYYTLDPSGTKVAFWVNTENTDPDSGPVDPSLYTQRLAVLDLETHVVTDYCFLGRDWSIPPVWSPDGKYLMVETGPLDLAGQVYVLDLEQLIAYQVATDLYPIGWMVAP